MGCFSSGCFKEELLDILRCTSCQAHDFNKSSLPMSSIYSDVKQLAGSSCQMIWTFMNFARVTLRRASLRGASWAPWIKLTYIVFVGPGTTSLMTCFRQLAGQGQCLFWIPTTISCQKFSG